MTTTIIILIWLHFIGDFIWQTDAMAKNKSTSVKWLSSHCAVYTLFLLPIGWKFALINGVLHWVTDFFTSRATAYLWKKEERHWFFVVIGLDQAIHMTTLIASLYFLM